MFSPTGLEQFWAVHEKEKTKTKQTDKKREQNFKNRVTQDKHHAVFTVSQAYPHCTHLEH